MFETNPRSNSLRGAIDAAIARGDSSSLLQRAMEIERLPRSRESLADLRKYAELLEEKVDRLKAEAEIAAEVKKELALMKRVRAELPGATFTLFDQADQEAESLAHIPMIIEAVMARRRRAVDRAAELAKRSSSGAFNRLRDGQELTGPFTEFSAGREWTREETIADLNKLAAMNEHPIGAGMPEGVPFGGLF